MPFPTFVPRFRGRLSPQIELKTDVHLTSSLRETCLDCHDLFRGSAAAVEGGSRSLKGGAKQAPDSTFDDSILDALGSAQSISTLEKLAPDEGQQVINVDLEGEPAQPH